MSEMRACQQGKGWSVRGTAPREEPFPTDGGCLGMNSFPSDFSVWLLAEWITNMNTFDPNTPGESVVFLLTHRFGA